MPEAACSHSDSQLDAITSGGDGGRLCGTPAEPSACARQAAVDAMLAYLDSYPDTHGLKLGKPAHRCGKARTVAAREASGNQIPEVAGTPIAPVRCTCIR